ncbi:hypothetical protein G5V58_07525 [Nocardioides anomalus]|uniref:YfhO family protein n=1 Tax=Nocardioides anomalus TaxID=2712223 RepID=A0A6G6WBW5_9ACTN|nr:hypothetical protein [Nocardioides anomalus]QIG42647.1 hypothetical protein G5V58_07525 [Nocardioides anomalus]
MGLVRTDRVLQVALGMVAVQLVVRGYAAYGGWFVLDDFNFIARTGHFGLDPSVAARSYNGHVMPGGMYLSWFNQHVAPWQWWLPATELLLMQLVADLAMLRLLVVLHGRRPGILPPFALFLFSVLTLENAVWWAAGINALPFSIALLLALASHVQYLRSGRLRHVWAATVWVAVGLLFYEKTALVYLAVAIVSVTWFAEGYGWRRVASAVRGRRAGLAVYAATGAAYVALYVTLSRDTEVVRPTTFPTWQVVQAMVVDELVPALVGGPLQWAQFGVFSAADPGDPVVLAAVLGLGLVLAELLRHRRHAARALVLPVVFLVVDVVLVLLTQRLGSESAFVFDYRFQAEMAAVSAIALAAMTMPVRGALRSSSSASPSELLDHPRRVAAVVGLTSALAVVSAAGWTSNWHSDRRAEQFVRTLTGAVRDAPAPVPLVDRTVPDFVMAPIDRSGGLASRLLSTEPNARFPDVATDDLRVIDDEGRLREALVPGTRRAQPGPVAACGYQVATDPARIPLDGPVAFEGFWVRIGYLSSGASPVTVRVGDLSVETSVRPGVHALFVRGGSSFDSVQLSGLDEGTTLCTDDVSAGVPEPLDQPDPADQGASS